MTTRKQKHVFSKTLTPLIPEETSTSEDIVVDALPCETLPQLKSLNAPCDDKKKLLPRSTKQSIVISLLERTEGATLDELMSASGWQRHSVRGVLSGALKKRLKLPVTSTVEERGRVYRITGVGA